MSFGTPLDTGYVSLYRKITEWEWYTNTNVKSLFIHCLLRANHKSQKWQGIAVERGAFITSLAKLSVETGMSLKAVRIALKHLESTGEIKQESTNKFTKIIVTNYNYYQEQGKQGANKRQAEGKQTTSN